MTHPMTDDEKVRANLKQELVQDAVNTYLTWKATGPEHGGNLHLLFARVFDRWQPELATLIQSQEREVTDAMVEAAAKAMHLDEYQNGHCDTETTYRSYLSPAKAALLAAIRSSSPTQEG